MKYLFLLLLLEVGFAVGGLAQDQSLTNVFQKSESISNLVFAIREQPRAEAEFEIKEAAIRTAGEMHDPNSELIAALIDNMAYTARHPNGWQFDLMNAPKYAYLPARDALATIGKPVIPVLLKKMRETDDEIFRIRYVSLLQEIAGKAQSIELLQKDIADVSKQKDCLEKSLKLIP